VRGKRSLSIHLYTALGLIPQEDAILGIPPLTSSNAIFSRPIGFPVTECTFSSHNMN